MATVHDVAAYILAKRGCMTAMKLQKLVYYSQAWSLVWDDAPLFGEKVEAWANGPVVRELYDRHRGQFRVSDWNGNADALTEDQRATVDAVLQTYGDKSSFYLSNLTHQEQPWMDARRGLPSGAPSKVEITHAAMAEYYSSLQLHPVAGLKPHQKKAVLSQYFDEAKTPKQAYDPNTFYEQRPAWRVSQLQRQDPFGWHEVTAPQLESIQGKLAQFESMTWAEILMKNGAEGKRPHHFIKLNRICDEARARLDEIFTLVDFEEMVSLRLTGVERVWGITEGSALRLIFWDPAHQICPSIRD